MTATAPALLIRIRLLVSLFIAGLVLSGVTSATAVARFAYQPTWIAASVADLPLAAP